MSDLGGWRYLAMVGGYAVLTCCAVLLGYGVWKTLCSWWDVLRIKRAPPKLRRGWRRWSWVILMICICGSVGAQTLGYQPPPLLDTSAVGDDPWVQRSMGVSIISWGGHRYLTDNVGNELCVRLLDDPAAPGPCHRSYFAVPPFGDRDYNLFNFSVCDDCRYGIAGFQSVGTVLFDLGAGTCPAWSGRQRYPGARNMGGFTFKVGSQQYLIANGLLDVCSGGAALMMFGGVLPQNLTFLQCANDAGDAPLSIDGGFLVPDSPNLYVYLVGGSYVYTVQLTGSGSGLGLVYRGQFLRAEWQRIRGLDVDLDAGPYGRLAAIANSQWVEIWDLDNPDNPYRVVQWDPTPPMVIGPNSVAVEYPYLWIAASGGQGTGWTYTYDITDPSSPQPLDPGFWDTSHEWNSYPYGGNIAAEFTADANYLFLSRWSVLERFRATWPTGGVFRDGFEAGTTAWSEVRP